MWGIAVQTLLHAHSGIMVLRCAKTTRNGHVQQTKKLGQMSELEQEKKKMVLQVSLVLKREPIINITKYL